MKEKKAEWKFFFEKKSLDIFRTKQYIVDIGGGLRIDRSKNNRFNKENADLLLEESKKVKYIITDVVDDYKPDVVADIHKMPFKDEEVDAIFCIAVLEHVEDPIRAVDECYRILKPEAKVLFYVPFLYYYHNDPGYCSDYWRYTHEGAKYLFRNFKSVELCAVRGRFGTAGRLVSPKYLEKIGLWLDRIFPKKSNQVSGYYIYAEK